eukprot:Pgem_evm1s17296
MTYTPVTSCAEWALRNPFWARTVCTLQFFQDTQLTTSTCYPYYNSPSWSEFCGKKCCGYAKPLRCNNWKGSCPEGITKKENSRARCFTNDYNNTHFNLVDETRYCFNRCCGEGDEYEDNDSDGEDENIDYDNNCDDGEGNNNDESDDDGEGDNDDESDDDDDRKSIVMTSSSTSSTDIIDTTSIIPSITFVSPTTTTKILNPRSTESPGTIVVVQEEIESNDNNASSTNVGAIVGGVIGGIVVVAAIIAAVVYGKNKMVSAKGVQHFDNVHQHGDNNPLFKTDDTAVDNRIYD